MKLEPIFNPHARIGHIVKKTKAEEKDELIEQTKQKTLERYGPKKNARKVGATNKTGANMADDDKSSFQLDEKIDEQTQGIKLLEEGFMQAYIDFFYLTHPDTKTPSYIEPQPEYEKEFQLNKRKRQPLDLSPDNLLQLKQMLVDGEQFQRENDVKKCFQTYLNVAQYYEKLNDYETASYFHKRCLDVSIEFKSTEGQAKAFKGLGICEERVYNKFEAEKNFETALEKAAEGGLESISREISQDLVRIYQLIAIQADQDGESQFSLNYFGKCLEMAQRVNNTDKMAECYQQIANIHERQGEMHLAIDYLTKFLEICLETKNNEKLGLAYKRLSEVESKNGNTKKAIENLQKVLPLVNSSSTPNRAAWAEATLGLGLLLNQDGKEHDIKQANSYLQQHFDLLRQETPKNQRAIDSARVSIGIVQANQKIEAYKYMVLNNLNGLVDWKVRRDHKNLQ